MWTKYAGADMILPSETVEYLTEITVFCTSLSGECYLCRSFNISKDDSHMTYTFTKVITKSD